MAAECVRRGSGRRVIGRTGRIDVMALLSETYDTRQQVRSGCRENGCES